MKEGEGEKESISYEEMVSHEWLLPDIAPQLRAIVPVKPSQATELDSEKIVAMTEERGQPDFSLPQGLSTVLSQEHTGPVQHEHHTKHW